MYTYNITSLVDHSIVEKWLGWQKLVNIPELLSTGLFSGHRLSQLLNQDETDGKTFVLQLFIKTKAEYESFLKKHEPYFQRRFFESWNDQALSFNSVMLEAQ